MCRLEFFFQALGLLDLLVWIFFVITLNELIIKFVVAIYKQGFNMLLVHFVMKMAKGLLLINLKCLSIVKWIFTKRRSFQITKKIPWIVLCCRWIKEVTKTLFASKMIVNRKNEVESLLAHYGSAKLNWIIDINNSYKFVSTHN